VSGNSENKKSPKYAKKRTWDESYNPRCHSNWLYKSPLFIY